MIPSLLLVDQRTPADHLVQADHLAQEDHQRSVLLIYAQETSAKRIAKVQGNKKVAAGMRVIVNISQILTSVIIMSAGVKSVGNYVVIPAVCILAINSTTRKNEEKVLAIKECHLLRKESRVSSDGIYQVWKFLSLFFIPL